MSGPYLSTLLLSLLVAHPTGWVYNCPHGIDVRVCPGSLSRTFIILYLLISSFSQQILFSFFLTVFALLHCIILMFSSLYSMILVLCISLRGWEPVCTPLVYVDNTQLHGLGGLSGGGVGGEVGGSKSTCLHAKILLARGWA